MKSRRCATAWLWVVVASLVAGAQQSAPENPSVFHSRATAVSLDVSVRRGNRPVAGLAVADFELTDNGVPQRIEQLVTDAVPIDVTLVIDASGSTASIFKGIRRDAQRILGLLRPQDRARVMVLETTPYELMPVQTVESQPVLLEERLPGDWSSVYDAILAGLVTRIDPDRRRLLVVITDGIDNKSITSLQALEGAVRRTDTVVHVISVIGGSSQRGVLPRRRTGAGFLHAEPTKPERELFERLPALSGGVFHDRRFGLNVDAVATLREVFEEFRTSYVIQYNPRGVAASGWHDVIVRVKGIDGKGVRTRAGYFDALR